MKIVIGLGNPGEKYARTRHNAGYRVVEVLAGDELEWREKKRYRAFIAEKVVPYASDIDSETEMPVIAEKRCLLVKPQTYMNRSGETVGRLMKEKSIEAADVWVVHDDADLAVGDIKISVSGKRSTHNGVRSVVDALDGEEFVRFRVGIGRPEPGERWEDYVLSSFRPNQKESFRTGVEMTVAAIKTALQRGVTAAMNQYN